MNKTQATNSTFTPMLKNSRNVGVQPTRQGNFAVMSQEKYAMPWRNQLTTSLDWAVTFSTREDAQNFCKNFASAKVVELA